jgi:hypothetical protein
MTTTTTTTTSAWRAEHRRAEDARRAGDTTAAWLALERAHILSQPHAVPHVRTHLTMLAWGVADRDVREVLGQVFRVLVAAPGSRSGRYPLGNTGRARVSAFAPMPVPADLEPVLAATRTEA